MKKKKNLPNGPDNANASSGHSASSLCVVVLDVARRCASLMMMRPVGT